MNYQMTAPNFDGMDKDDLWAYWQTNRDRSSEVIQLWAKYALTKCKAMSYREGGLIQTALECESQCDRIYQDLPQWARW